MAKCYGCERGFVRRTQRWSLCAMPGGGGQKGGEEEELLEDPIGVGIEQCAQCFLLVGTTTGHFLLSGWGGGREVVSPLITEEVGGLACHPDECPLAKVCHGEPLPWPTLQGHVGIKVPAGTILVVRKGMYGGVARVPAELEGVAQVVEWRQVQEYAEKQFFAEGALH